MNEKSKLLLALMFDEGEEICVSNSQFAYHSLSLETVLGDSVTLISPNKKVTAEEVSTGDLNMVSLNPIKGFRNDPNCYKFRNFLIEIDVDSMDRQIGYLKKLEMPYSSIVWSGSRSTHTLISLSETIPDEKKYRLIYKWILNIAFLSDQVLGNPSRSTRLAGAIRPETGKEQELIELKSRITHAELFAWLNKWPHLAPKLKPKRIIPKGEADYDKLSGWAKYQLKKGIQFKNGRSNTWHGLAYDFALAGYSEEKTIEELGKYYQEESDFKEREWLGTITSAFKRVDKK